MASIQSRILPNNELGSVADQTRVLRLAFRLAFLFPACRKWLKVLPRRSLRASPVSFRGNSRDRRMVRTPADSSFVQAVYRPRWRYADFFQRCHRDDRRAFLCRPAGPARIRTSTAYLGRTDSFSRPTPGDALALVVTQAAESDAGGMPGAAPGQFNARPVQAEAKGLVRYRRHRRRDRIALWRSSCAARLKHGNRALAARRSRRSLMPGHFWQPQIEDQRLKVCDRIAVSASSPLSTRSTA